MGRAAAYSSSGFKTISLLSRLRYIFLLATVLGAGYLLLYLKNNADITLFDTRLHISSWYNDKYETGTLEEPFTINTEGCSIPALNPFDEAIKPYVDYPIYVEPCSGSTFALLDSNRTHIWIKHNNKEHFNITRRDRLVCCYRSFYRPASINDISSDNVDHRVSYNKCEMFSDHIKVSDEFVKVECLKNGVFIYKQFFLFAFKKNFSTHDEKEMNETKPTYNILVLGIDAVSRLNFHRTMPKTLQFLKDRGAVELLGYNKVGDNTFPNIIPMLLGFKDTELKRTCLPNSRSTFDNCPFIWEWYKQSGYYTAFAEDSSSLGTFNYQRSGFSNTPTDYYLHTFIHEAEENAGNNFDFNSFLCMNEKYFYDILLNYIENLSITLKSNRLFGFFWEITMSHDYLNYPMIMDSSYEDFLKKLDASKYLEESILLLISDHGIRWGDIRVTKQGRLEERLPFVYILVPPSFSKKYSEAYTNLKINSKRLTTPFDIHATLYDLVDLNNIKNEKIQARKQTSYGRNRGISLFLPIWSNRTCLMAGIDDHWCTCQRSRKLPSGSAEALTAASELLSQLNNQLHDYRQCATLKLVEILEVSEVDVGKPSEEEIGWREFMVVVRTEPGSGVFEGTLRHDDHNWSLTGTISRLNLYGNQSRCMHNYQMKLYCFCK
ncbi:uncharacterized protein [Epargyreus clarus]|uniref:uncharacterized protein isoform X2 n=1 Tax=Epargyreus clarus TaxID=520877 RepID=UPI003C2E3755